MLILGLQKTTLLDFPGKVASTIFTGGCNFKCGYCQNGDLVLNPTLMEAIPEEEVIRHLRKRAKVIEGLCITGGEPTLQKDLYPFIQQVREMGYKIKLDTNGTNPSVLQQLIDDEMLDYVAMDIKECPEKYPIAAECKGFLVEKVEESVQILLKNKVEYEFRSTICGGLQTYDDIRAMGTWLDGAKAIYLQPYQESDKVIKKGYGTPSKKLLEDYVEILSSTIEKVEIRGLD